MSEGYCQNCGECCLDLHFMIAPVDVGEVDIREFYGARGIEVREQRGLLWAIVPHRCPTSQRTICVTFTKADQLPAGNTMVGYVY